MTALKRAWSDLTGGHSEQDFTYWLENTVVTDGLQSAPDAIRYLDSLDDFLLAAIQEVEELQGRELMPSEIEAELIRIWKHTYSFASMREEEQMRRIWLDRGRTIMDHYPEAAQRRRIYKTSLSPRSAAALLDNLATIKEKILEGTGYTDFTHEERFIFVKEVLALLSQVPSFHISTQLGRRRDFREWTTLLRWWLAKGTLPQQPEPGEITRWFEFVAQNFIYRGTWGLGSLVGLLLDLADGDTPVRPLEIADWPRSGLPWIAFWLKELITWGTLEPVAAFLLARGNAMDRQEAEAEARIYYEELPAGLDPNEKLNPQRIRAFVEERRPRQQGADRVSEVSIRIRLEKGRNAYINPKMSVVPIEIENRLIWIDPAGYTVARSPKPADWIEKPSQYSFELNVRNGVVLGTAYLPYARS